MLCGGWSRTFTTARRVEVAVDLKESCGRLPAIGARPREIQVGVAAAQMPRVMGIRCEEGDTRLRAVVGPSSLRDLRQMAVAVHRVGPHALVDLGIVGLRQPAPRRTPDLPSTTTLGSNDAGLTAGASARIAPVGSIPGSPRVPRPLPPAGAAVRP